MCHLVLHIGPWPDWVGTYVLIHGMPVYFEGLKRKKEKMNEQMAVEEEKEEGGRRKKRR